MNQIQQLQFLQRVTTDAKIEDAAAVLAAGVLLSFVNHENGRCDPSMPTLCRRARRGEETMRRGLQELEATGHIEIERRFNQSNAYILKLKDVTETVDHPREIAPPPSEIEVTPPSEIQPLTGRKNLEPLPEPADDVGRKVSGREVEWLVKRWQQLADKPGWKMAKAFAAVVAAIKRAGFGAVSHLYAQLKDSGKRPGWWLERELRELGPVSVPTSPLPEPCSAEADVSERGPLPKEALAKVREARLLVSDAITNPPLWARIVAAIEAIGLNPAKMYDRDRAIDQLARAMGQGQTVRA